MSAKIRITVKIVPVEHGPPELKDSAAFALPVDATSNFFQVWNVILQRYEDNYAAGRRKNFVFKKIQDVHGADIDLRDSVADIFEGETDPRNRVVQVIRAPVDRFDSIPVGSHLQPPRPEPTPDQLEQMQRTQDQISRYGSALEDLSPDVPVPSAERELAPNEQRRHTHKLDRDGFLMPQRIDRPAFSAPQAQRSNRAEARDEDPLENHTHTAPDTHRSIPFPSIPYAAVPTPCDHVGEIPTDPIEDEEESRRERSTVLSHRSPDSSSPIRATQLFSDRDEAPVPREESPGLSQSSGLALQQQNPASRRTESRSRSLVRQRPWALDEENSLLEALAQGMSDQDIHTTLFPGRTWEGVRKKTRSMRSGREAQIRSKKETLQNKASAAAVFKNDDAAFVNAIRNNWDWRRLHETRFPHKSEDSVKMYFVEVRHRLDAEDKAAAAALHSQHRLQEQARNGVSSTGPSERFTTDEDDLLLAARFQQAEMKRVAAHYFPLRPYEQIRSRASSLYHDAERAANKPSQTLSQGSVLSQADRVFDALDSDLRRRIEVKRKQIQQDERLFSEQRSNEFENKALQKRKMSEEKIRNEGKRQKMKESIKRLTALEDAAEKRRQVDERRLQEDLRNNAAYNNDYAAWYAQAEADRAAGRSAQPSPKRPQGSSIGTEVMVTSVTTAPARSGPLPNSEQKQANGSVQVTSTPQHGHDAVAALAEIQATQAATSSGKKRRVVTPVVEIMVSSKKQKARESEPLTTPADGATTRVSGATTSEPAVRASSVNFQKATTTTRKSSLERPRPGQFAKQSPVANPNPLTKTPAVANSSAKIPAPPILMDAGMSNVRTARRSSDIPSMATLQPHSTNDIKSRSATIPLPRPTSKPPVTAAQASSSRYSPFKSRLASKVGDVSVLAASQPLDRASVDASRVEQPESLSSPSRVSKQGSFVNLMKNRQSTLSFQRTGFPRPRPGAPHRNQSDLPTPESREPGPATFVISSDSESYSDSDINDDDLAAVAEKSSQFWSSPANRRDPNAARQPKQQTSGLKGKDDITSSPPAVSAQPPTQRSQPREIGKALERKTVIPDSFDPESQLLLDTQDAVPQSYSKGMAYSKMAAAAGCGFGHLPKDKYGHSIIPDRHQDGARKPVLESISSNSQETQVFQTQDPSTTLSQKLLMVKGMKSDLERTQGYKTEAFQKPNQSSNPISLIPLSQRTTQGEIEGSAKGATSPDQPASPLIGTAQESWNVVGEMTSKSQGTTRNPLPFPKDSSLNDANQCSVLTHDENGIEEINGYRSETGDESDYSISSNVIRQELRVRLPGSMTEEQKDLFFAGPPRMVLSEQKARAQEVNRMSQNTINSVNTADLAPPFPSSGKVRSVTPTPAPEQRRVQSSPIVLARVNRRTPAQLPMTKHADVAGGRSRASLSNIPPSTTPAATLNAKSGRHPAASTATDILYNTLHSYGRNRAIMTSAELAADLKKQRDAEARKVEAEKARAKARSRQRKKEHKKRIQAAKAAKKAKAARKVAGDASDSDVSSDSDEDCDPIADMSRQAQEFAAKQGVSRPWP
ncbi:hypothetical protein MBLNU459_g8205t1 [Dothideomycetes sp. NU459]